MFTLVINYLKNVCSRRGPALVLHDLYAHTPLVRKLEVHYLTTDDLTLEMRDISLDKVLRSRVIAVDTTGRWHYAGEGG